jgi:hypothetical protein
MAKDQVECGAAHKPKTLAFVAGLSNLSLGRDGADILPMGLVPLAAPHGIKGRVLRMVTTLSAASEEHGSVAATQFRPVLTI